MARRLSPIVAAQHTAALKERDDLAAQLKVASEQRDDFATKLAKAEYDLSERRKDSIKMLDKAHKVIQRLERELKEARRLAEGRLQVAQEALRSPRRGNPHMERAANDTNLSEASHAA